MTFATISANSGHFSARGRQRCRIVGGAGIDRIEASLLLSRQVKPPEEHRTERSTVAQNIGPLSLDLDLKAKPLRDRCVAFPVTPMFQHELSGAGFPSAEYECNVATGADGVRRIARFGR